LPTQITKVADISTCRDVCDKNQIRDKPVCVARMEFSPLQGMGIVGDKVHDKVADLSRTQIMKVGDVICVADFHDLCLRQVRDFVANLSRTLSQSRRNGIWA